MHAWKLLLKGQTNFIKMIWKFSKVYNANRQYEDHQRPVPYEMKPPASSSGTHHEGTQLYVHRSKAEQKLQVAN
jgi:hypothetical protein